MNKLGIVLNNLGPSQLAYNLIKSGDELVDSQSADLTLFFYEISPVCGLPLFAIMNLSEAYNYKGIVIATDLNSASRIQEFPGPSKKFYYVWDLEYLRLPQRNYEELCGVYKKLPLIVRSKQHEHFIGKIWGGNVVGVCENANVNELWSIVNGYTDSNQKV